MADQTSNIKLEDIWQGVRVRLQHPPISKIRNLDITLTLFQVLGNYKTDMKLVDQNWFIAQAEFPVNPLQNDFPVSLPNFSRALVVEWINPARPSEPGVEVEIINFQDSGLVPVNRTRMIEQSDSISVAATDIAHAISFRGLPPNMTVRLTPTPQDTAQRYRVYYAPANTPITDIQGNIEFPAEFTNLLILATANSMVGMCGYTLDQYKQLKGDLGPNLADAKENFRWYINQNKQQSARSSRGYAPPASGTWRIR